MTDKTKISKKYFNIAFEIKNASEFFGVSKESVLKFIEREFDIVSSEVINRHFDCMVDKKFIFSSLNGVKTHPKLDAEYYEFQKRTGGI